MSNRSNVVDIKGWIVCELTKENFATLLAACNHYDRPPDVDDPTNYGVDRFDGDMHALRAELKTLPHYEMLETQVTDYDNFYEYCGFGWKHFGKHFNPTKKDLARLKLVLEQHGFVVDERIEDDRFVYIG